MDIIHKINEIAEIFFNGNNSAFAKKFETSEANIRNYRSKIIPKVDFIVKMCNDLEISFDWIFNDIGPMIRPSTHVKEKNPQSLLNVNFDETINALNKTIKAQEITIESQRETIATLKQIIAIKRPEPQKGTYDPTGAV